MKIKPLLPFFIAQSHHYKEFFRIMRMSLFLLFVCAFQLLATNTAAQHTKIEIETEQISVRQLIAEIEKQTDFLILFRNSDVDVDRIIHIPDNAGQITNYLDAAFSETDVHYEFQNKYIVLSKDEVASLIPQQTGDRITGVVLDELGDPVIGANIIVKGTTIGVTTDIDGKFQISVPRNGVLQISYIGYNTQEITITNQTSLTIRLEENTQSLEEVVVVGYGAQKKVNLTGSVASITSEQLLERPITSVAEGIQGIVPGLTVTAGQSRPGDSNTSMRVRGQGTLNNADPYILIDGVESGNMNELDPNDIESISVLKDAASAAIYGSKAANGVILITTKRGNVGRPIISYSGRFGWQAATGFVERMNSADAATYYNRALAASGKAPRFSEEEIQKFRNGSDPYAYPDTDWNDLGFQGNGFMHQHNISMNGGTENAKYMASIGYLNQNGIMVHSNRQQVNMRTNFDAKVSDKVNVRVNMAYIKNDTKDPTNSYVGNGSDQIIRQLNRIAPWVTYKYADGTYGTIGDGNPIAWLDLDQTLDRKNQNFSGILAIDYDIIKGLKFTAQGAYVSNIRDQKEFVKDIQYNASKYHGPNWLSEQSTLWNRISMDLLLNYNNNFGKHNVKGMFGYRLEDYNYKYTRAYRQGFPNNDLTDINAGTQSTQTNEGNSRELAMMSYFGRANYDYAGKYLFEVNFRADASSRFSPDNRWGYFPSVSAGWRISEEEFMQFTSDWMQSLKIRASLGTLGNQEALNDYYPWMVTYAIGTSYTFDGVTNTGITQSSQKLESISWEKSKNWGIGLDISVLSCLDVTIDYYNRETTGILMDMPVPGSFGLGAYKDNIGAMRNSGFEISAAFRKKFGDWRFAATANTAMNRNEILDLGGVNEMIDSYRINRVGHPYRSYYGYVADGLFQTQEEADAYTATYGNPFNKPFKAGDIKYVDVDKNGKLTADDRDLTDSEMPKLTFGLNLSVSWKNFDLSVFGQGALGVSRYYNNEVFGDFGGDSSHPSTAWFDAWSPENPNGKFPRVAENSASASMPGTTSTFWIQKTNYLRIKNIQFGYNLPKDFLKVLGVSRAKIYYSGENLFKFDNLPINIDPESPSGRGSHYPQVSANSIGINLTF